MDYSLFLLNGISYGMLLFILASGLTLILGVMKTLNLAHGTFFLLGFYTAQWVIRLTNNFFLGAVAGAFAAGIIGMAVQRFLLSRVPADPSPQTLLTVGIIYVFQDIFLMISKGRIWMLPKPHFLAGSIPFGGLTFPTYRIALTAMGCIIFVLLWLFIRKTKWGAILRAGADKPKIAEAVGINIPLVWVMVFGLGIFMAGLAGVLAGPIWGAFPGGEWRTGKAPCHRLGFPGMRIRVAAGRMLRAAGRILAVLEVGNSLEPLRRRIGRRGLAESFVQGRNES